MTERIDYDDDGELDEIVVNGGAHLERMGEKSWFLLMHRQDGTSVGVWFRGKVVQTEERL